MQDPNTYKPEDDMPILQTDPSSENEHNEAITASFVPPTQPTASLTAANETASSDDAAPLDASPLTDAAAPLADAAQDAEEGPLLTRKRRKRRPMSIKMRIFLILFISITGVVAISAVAEVFTLYEVSFTRDDGSFAIQLEPRFPEPPPRNVPPPPSPGLLPQQEDRDRELPAPSNVFSDGTTLELQPRPAPSSRLSFQEIYQEVSPSVVLVEVSIRGAFGVGIGTGTGVVISEHGFILTSAHVVEDARSITITLYDGLRFEAILVGMDLQTDIAVLKVDADDLIPATFGDSDLVQVGEEVAVIGNPLGQSHTMSNGIISAVNRDIYYDGISMRMLQTNAAINEGNSGGPLINLYGQVIGIANLKLVNPDGSVEGMGFAIPTAIIKPVVDTLLAYGEMPARPSIGIVVATVDATEALHTGLAPGLYVENVAENTDAYAQGLQAGDRIIAAADIAVHNVLDLRSVIGRFRIGDTLTLTIERDDEIFDLDVILMDSDLIVW